MFSKVLPSSDHNPRVISKADKDFAKKLDFKEVKFSVKIRDVQKIEKMNSISISIFGYKNKEKYPIHVSKNTFKNYVDLLLIGEKGTLFLSKIFIDLCMIIHYIEEENTFAVIIYKLSVQRKF